MGFFIWCNELTIDINDLMNFHALIFFLFKLARSTEKNVWSNISFRPDTVNVVHVYIMLLLILLSFPIEDTSNKEILFCEINYYAKWDIY